MNKILFLTGVCIMMSTDVLGKTNAAPGSTTTAEATFAGGCFWCMETPFTQLPGVNKVVSGYTGGTTKNPTYEEVCSGSTGHYEAVRISFDPEVIGYRELLEVFWRNIDPTDAGGQFGDRGTQYKTAIFFNSNSQRDEAIASREALEASGIFNKRITTAILPVGTFYPAETYHQEYYKKNPVRYRQYHEGSGRGPFLRRLWEDPDTKTRHAKRLLNLAPVTKYQRPSDRDLKQRLTSMQYNVAVCSTTEPPFNNAYWNNHREGLYVDIISGAPLFSSKDKFDSGTGWPSFSRSVDSSFIIEKEDTTHGLRRIEVRSRHGDAHLGHLFPDGPKPTGLRYCINSAALRFIPVEDLEKEGYGAYRKLFK